MAEVWFAIPSASAERRRAHLPMWRERGYKIALLLDGETSDGAADAETEALADAVVWRDRYPGWAASLNLLCNEAALGRADIVVSGGDDMRPDPRFEAAELAEQFLDRFPDGFGVMQPCGDTLFSAGHHCGSPWIGRRFFETMYGGNGPCWPGYRHNWADVELYQVSRCLNALWMRSDVEQRHHHHVRDGGEAPTWWVRNVVDHDQRDNELHLVRKYRGFPGHEPIGVDRTLDREALFGESDLGLAERHWLQSYAPQEAAKRTEAAVMSSALDRLAAAGKRRVAIYGAGAHTRSAAPALATPSVTIEAVIEDEPTRHGTRLFGFPVVSRDAAIAMRVDAVVISTDAFERTVYERNAAAFAAAGIELVRLYEHVGPDAVSVTRAGAGERSEEPV